MTKAFAHFLALGILLLGTHISSAVDVISGRFELVDHNGQLVDEHSYDGKMRLVFFGFTQCPDVCPTTLFEVSRALKQLGDEAGHVQTLFISIDIKNDTPETLGAYVGVFHPSFVGLTGSEKQLAAAAAAFNVTYGFEPAGQSASGRDEMFHTSYLFLMDRDGRFVDVFGYGTKAEIITRAIRENSIGQ